MDIPLNTLSGVDRASLERYAQLIVTRGCNVQPGQFFQIGADSVSTDFAVLVAKAAYEAGAGFVNVDLSDDRFQRARVLGSAKDEFLDHVPAHIPVRFDEMIDSRSAVVRLIGPRDPSDLAGLPASKMNQVRMAGHKAAKRFYSEGIGLSAVQWCVASAATIGWAESIMDDVQGEEARTCLWNELLQIVRADREDCFDRWRDHGAYLKERGRRLNELQLDSLHFSGPGTDLSVGLSELARFEGGGAMSQREVEFVPNLPTEEVFTTPDWRRTEGVVRVTRPFVVNGELVRDLTMTFSAGELVDFDASEGAETLKAYVDSDPGARRLGEVALVGTDSPIFQNGRVFKEILLDENAACHIAVGNAYKSCLEGGEGLSQERLDEIGCNSSSAHTDMMISDESVQVIGRSSNGKESEIIRDGAWVLGE